MLSSKKKPVESTSMIVGKGGDGSPQKSSSDIPSDSTMRGEVPRFLIVKRLDGDFSAVSPFLIDKVLTGQIGQVNAVRKINEGLLVETKSTTQSRKLLDLKKFHDFEVTVSPHNSLNYSKGVITCRDLLNCSIVEIAENLEDQGVIDVKRITTMREGKRQESASLILTFSSDKLPNKVKAGFHSITVRPYIPAPLRCFKCQRFGHTSMKCNQKEVCVCGKEPHPNTACADPIKCVNCEGPHMTRSRDCPVYKEEMAIQKIKVEEKISFAEARRKVKGSTTLRTNVSYARATASTSLTQTGIKDIIKELIPEIVQICTSILQGTLQNKSENSEKQRSSKEKRPLSSDPPTSEEKRKCAEETHSSDNESTADQVMSDTDESGTQGTQDFVAPRNVKSKRGWQKGRRRKITN